MAPMMEEDENAKASACCNLSPNLPQMDPLPSCSGVEGNQRSSLSDSLQQISMSYMEPIMDPVDEVLPGLGLEASEAKDLIGDSGDIWSTESYFNSSVLDSENSQNTLTSLWDCQVSLPNDPVSIDESAGVISTNLLSAPSPQTGTQSDDKTYSPATVYPALSEELPSPSDTCKPTFVDSKSASSSQSISHSVAASSHSSTALHSMSSVTYTTASSAIKSNPLTSTESPRGTSLRRKLPMLHELLTSNNPPPCASVPCAPLPPVPYTNNLQFHEDSKNETFFGRPAGCKFRSLKKQPKVSDKANVNLGLYGMTKERSLFTLSKKNDEKSEKGSEGLGRPVSLKSLDSSSVFGKRSSAVSDNSCQAVSVCQTKDDSSSHSSPSEASTQSNLALQKVRFQRTKDALEKSGLLDITIRTANLLKSNTVLDSDISDLKRQTQQFLQSVLANSENAQLKQFLLKKKQEREALHRAEAAAANKRSLDSAASEKVPSKMPRRLDESREIETEICSPSMSICPEDS